MATKSYTFSAFCANFGEPEVRKYNTNGGFISLVCVDEEGNETFVSPGRTGCSVVFDTVDHTTEQIEASYKNLDVLVGESVTTGETVYTLVDHHEFENETRKVVLK